MRLAARLFLGTSVLLTATVGSLIVAADQLLRDQLEQEIAGDLEREARLVAALLPPDSLSWSAMAHQLGGLTGHRVTLIDSTGHVRGDTEFERAALSQLENHAGRPEVRQALAAGVGRDARLSESTNQRRLYVAVRGGPRGLAIVRLSTTLERVDATVGVIQRGVAFAGIVALGAAALLAWLVSGVVAKPLVQLGAAARAIAEGEPPLFPDSRVPEISEHILALHAMHEQLAERFGELRRERQEMRTLIESMADGVLAADASGSIAMLNTAARRLLGLRAPGDPPPLSQLFHEKRARDLVREAFGGREIEQHELDLDGRSLLVSGRPLPNGGALLVFRDVTALRRLEAVRRDFVANVSHEMKTPLTSIVGYAETLSAEAAEDTHTRQFADIILSNARRMQRLVDDLLDLSRIESGSWRPARRLVDVAALAQEIWEAGGFAERARAPAIRFKVEIAPAAATIAADPDALRQIFVNLFDNALRYTPAGGAITVRAQVGAEGVVLSVADTGSGVPPEHLPRIFERFYRADAARSRAQGGTGLGLAIVKHLTEGHGGRVSAASTLGRGTTIEMFFPSETATP